MLTQAKLKEELIYEPDTGLLIRKKWVNKNMKNGAATGSKDIVSGYVRIYINNKLYQAHRLAYLYMTGNFPENEIDHINGVRDDNRWVNLRGVNRSENNKNAIRRCDNKSGVTGVNWHKLTAKWVAQIQSDKQKIHLGLYDDKFEAICARKSAEVKYGFHENHGKILAKT